MIDQISYDKQTLARLARVVIVFDLCCRAYASYMMNRPNFGNGHDAAKFLHPPK